MDRRVLQLTEVAEVTNTSITTLRYWRQIGEGPPLWKLGRRVVAYEDEVRAWLDTRREAQRA